MGEREAVRGEGEMEAEREAVRGEGEGATVKSTVSSKKLSGHQSPCQSPRGLSGE